jgi:hypothetical protein
MTKTIKMIRTGITVAFIVTVGVFILSAIWQSVPSSLWQWCIPIGLAIWFGKWIYKRAKSNE